MSTPSDDTIALKKLPADFMWGFATGVYLFLCSGPLTDINVCSELPD